MGIPLVENKKASWFIGFLVFDCCFSFYGFLVSRFYQFSTSCFREDIDPISKMFSISLDGSSDFVGARLFQNRQKQGFPNLETYKNNIFEDVPKTFPDFC